jgi:serine/threonine-protein kinase
MTRKGPLVTLLAGLTLAVILLAISVNAARDRGPAGAALESPKPTPLPTASPTAAASPSPPAIPDRGTYAARVSGNAGTVAIAVHDGKAIAYFCDGRRIEAWMQGTAADDGALSLASLQGARLAGSFAGGRISGSIDLEGKRWSFVAPAAHPPGGLYRAAATVNSARIDGGWIVLPDGTQVGVVSVNAAKTAAPHLDTATRSTTVSGQHVTATSIDGTSGSGF